MILLISFVFRLQSPNQRLMAIVLLISAGVSLASYGELAFDLTGFLIQASSVFVSPRSPTPPPYHTSTY